MIEFSFEIIDNANIYIEYQYGSEKVLLNLFSRQGVWTIHPFNGILLQNHELCRHVMIDLFKNKHFQIMLAKENIQLSELRTSIDLDPEATDRRERQLGPDRNDEVQDYIESHSINDIFSNESELITQRLTMFKEVLQKMFMDNYGPGDREFDQIQELVRIYNDALGRINALAGYGFGGNERDRRRF